jgi:hypothetical protein
MSFADLVASADRAALAHLGSVTVSYSDDAGEPVEVEGIFDERYVLIDDATAGIQQVTPALFVLLADLPGEPSEEDRVTIAGTEYRVREVQPDSMGGVLLLLHVAEV